MMLVDSLEHYTAHSKRCDPIFHSIPDITFFPVVGVCVYIVDAAIAHVEKLWHEIGRN